MGLLSGVRTRSRSRLGVALIAAVAVAAGGLVACVPQPTAGISCAWPNISNRDSLNVAYPDASATYFTTPYQLAPGQSLVIDGTYPFARYSSLHTYSLTGAIVDHLTDTDIAPRPGSDNPSTNAAASLDPAERKWTVQVSADLAPGAGSATNSLAATASPGSTAFGSVILRVYVPNTPGDLAGGVALPALSVRSATGTVTPIAQCATASADTSVVGLINAFGPATDIPATDPPVFKRPLSVGGLYANSDNAYVAAIAAYQPGKVVVIRGKAPTTPDTMNGESAASPTDLRYWSICSNEYRKPYPVTSCGYDQQFPLDANGEYTLVVSTPGERPANALTSNGVFWLDWGSTAVDMVMIARHMLPAATFAESVQALAPGQPASPQMGAYAPVAATCTVATFEAGGAAACGLT